MEKPSLPKGTRDFGPENMLKRQYLLQTIKTIFTRYGFLPLETPAMENLSVLTGKYGDEGDQLIYKILNSGDFIQGISEKELNEGFKKLHGEQKILVIPEIILIQEDVWSFLSQVRMLKKYLADNGIEKCHVILSPFRCKLLYFYSKILDFSIMRYTAA